MAEDITDSITAERIIIVCLGAERKVIESLLSQVGWRERIKGVITIDDLESWYGFAFAFSSVFVFELLQ